MEEIIQKYSEYLAQANHDKVLLEIRMQELEEEINTLKLKYGKSDGDEEVENE